MSAIEVQNKETHSIMKLTIKNSDPLYLQTSDGLIEITPSRSEQTPVLIKAPRSVQIATKRFRDRGLRTDEELVEELKLLQELQAERLEDLKRDEG